MSKIEVSDIVNWVLTASLIIAILYAGHQRYFEASKCQNWCEDNLKEAQLSLNGEILNCRVNWSNVFAEEQDYSQNKSLAQKMQNLNNEFQEETEDIKNRINEVTI